MINGIVLFVFFYAGFSLGCWVSRKPPVIKEAKITNLVVDQKLLDRIEADQVDAWLKRHGLVWQPKGAVFDLKKGVKNGHRGN